MRQHAEAAAARRARLRAVAAELHVPPAVEERHAQLEAAADVRQVAAYVPPAVGVLPEAVAGSPLGEPVAVVPEAAAK